MELNQGDTNLQRKTWTRNFSNNPSIRQSLKTMRNRENNFCFILFLVFSAVRVSLPLFTADDTVTHHSALYDALFLSPQSSPVSFQSKMALAPGKFKMRHNTPAMQAFISTCQSLSKLNKAFHVFVPQFFVWTPFTSLIASFLHIFAH